MADRSKSPGERIVSAQVAGAPLDPDASYKVSTNSFVASGREGFVSMKDAKVILGETDGELVSSIVTRHIEALGEISPRTEGRIELR